MTALPLPEEQLFSLPLIRLGELRGDTAHYNAIQKFLLPFLPQLLNTLWICFFAIGFGLLVRFVLMPLFTGQGAVAPSTPAGKEQGGFAARYRRFFHLDEVENDVALLLFGGAILLGYLVFFNRWQMDPVATLASVTNGKYICWPFFQDCDRLIWMKTLPQGYSQTIVFMGMFMLITTGAYALFTRRVVLAHACILVLFLFRIYMTLIYFFYNNNYDYYHNVFSFIFLFLPYKRFFGSLSIVVFYYLSTAAKIHPGWVWGGYFTALRDGLPLFPRGTEPLATNLVIFMEMVMSWFLFSSRKRLQRVVFAFFCLFHVYSGTLVGYLYPTVVMPSLIIFFGPLFKPFKAVPLDRASLAGWAMVAMLACLQMIPVMMPGDTKLTLENSFYGLYMFEANHQCRVVMTEGQEVLKNEDQVSARFRCYPQVPMLQAQHVYCAAPPYPKIAYSMIHSINGGPFYKIVDEADLCALRYKPFGHNEWIKDERSAPIVGRPVVNIYR